MATTTHGRRWAALFYLCGDVRTAGDEPLFAELDVRLAASAWARTWPTAFYVDGPGGARRGVVRNGRVTVRESLGPSNSGHPATLEAFLRWALDECPADDYVLVFGGHGILESEGDAVSARRTFAICDDYTAGDALDLGELSTTLRRCFPCTGTARRVGPCLQVLAFDMAAVQFLEVCYELRGVATVVVAEQPQTAPERAPREPWDYRALLDAWAGTLARGVSPTRPGVPQALAAAAVALAGQRGETGTWSAIALGQLGPVVEAFDTFSAVLFQWLSSEVVWDGRQRTFDRLHAPTGSGPQMSASTVFSYDLARLGRANAGAMRDASGDALARWAEAVCRRQTTCQLFELGSALLSSMRVDEPLHAEVAPVIARLERLRERLRDGVMPGARDRTAEPADWADAFGRIFRMRLGTPAQQRWEAIWTRALPRLGEPLVTEYEHVCAGRRVARQLADLAESVEAVIRPGADSPVVALAGSRGCGLSLYRPFELENLTDPSYLALAFSKELHWTSLLTAVKLVSQHPRTLWRLVESQLTAAPPSARYELLERLAGPSAVTGRFAAQLRALAPPPATTLVVESLTGHAGFPHPMSPADSIEVCVRVAPLSGAVVQERHRTLKQGRLESVLAALTDIARRPYEDADRTIRVLQECGRLLGDDVLGNVVISTDGAFRGRMPHLLLQVPAGWMSYPWELLEYQRQPLWTQFAIGRQVQADVVPASRPEARSAGPIRVLVINPRLHRGYRPVGAREGRSVTRSLQRFAARLPGMVDVDARTDVEVSVADFRACLRAGYDVVHLATHGHYDDEHPSYSHWQFSDGPLYAYELRNTLSSAPTVPWLVLANACESAGAPAASGAAGAHRGLHGLAAAAIGEGVSAFIAPLWEVDDDDATVFADAFYRALLVERLSVGESLGRARGVLVDPAGHSGLAHRTISAAGLTLYGDPTPNILQRFTPAQARGRVGAQPLHR